MKRLFSPFLTLFVALFFFASSPAMSQSIDLSSLPEPVRKELLLQLQKSTPVQAPVQTAAQAPVEPTKKDKELHDLAREWGGLGQAVASGIVSAAREVGVAANDFAKTSLGKIIIAVLLWKYFGAQLVGIIFGSIILFGGISFGWHMVKKASNTSETLEYSVTPVLWGLFTVRKVVKKSFVRDCKNFTDPQVFQTILGYILMALSGIVGAIAIF